MERLIEITGINDSANRAPYLNLCFLYFEQEFTKKSLKINVLDLDYESPEFLKLITGFKLEVNEVATVNNDWKYPGTFKYVNAKIDSVLKSRSDLLKIIDNTFNGLDLY